MASGYTLADVHGMTLGQLKAFGEAAENRRKKSRTELLFLLRGAKYDKKPFNDLLKASRSATWLTPS